MNSTTSTQDEKSRSRPPIALSDGTILREEYRVEEVLGMGSFGITYRCVDEHLDTSVAIKEYYPRQIAGRTGESSTVRPHSSEATEDFEYGLQQFMQEGRTVARFDHPNVVDVKSYFEENGTGYLVMNYYEGQSLSQYLAANNGQLPEVEAVEIIQDVLDGLHSVHEAGVLHRDIDPHNIYRTDEGEAILIDFGAAREAVGRRSQSLDVILKPGYAPIEQYSAGGDQGPWTDVYACSATLYKCLTGIKPPEATERVQQDELIPPRQIKENISMETSLAVRKGLALRPKSRPVSAREFAELLGRTRTGGNQTQAPVREEPFTRQPGTEPGEMEDSKGTSSLLESGAEVERDEAAKSESSRRPDARAAVEAGADNRSVVSAGNLLGLVVAVVSVVGGTLLFSDTDAVEVFSFFGTWIAVCGGLVGLFRQGERLMAPEGRAAITDWLLREDFTDRSSNWPKTFTNLFDAVFTGDHLSWKCFWRSSMVSAFLLSICYMLMVKEGRIVFSPYFPTIDFVRDFIYHIADTYFSNPTGRIWGSYVLAFLTSLLFNVMVDYVSLYETRRVLGRMARSKRLGSYFGYLVLDVLLTAIIFVILLTSWRIVFGTPAREALSDIDNLYTILYSSESYVPVGDTGLPLAYTTLFTSVWVWLYAGSGLVLRTLWPAISALDWLKRFFNVKHRPVEAIGFMVAVIVSVVFALSAPFVL